MGRGVGNWRVNYICLQYRKLQTQSLRSNPSHEALSRETQIIGSRHAIHQKARSAGEGLWGPLVLRPPIEGCIATTSIK